MYYRFIKITDCNDYRHFVIDMTKMQDPRIRTSILESKFRAYSKGVGTYKPLYAILGETYSSYCCFRGEFADFDEVKKTKAQLERFYQEKLIQSKYQPAEFSNTVSFLEVSESDVVNSSRIKSAGMR